MVAADQPNRTHTQESHDPIVLPEDRLRPHPRHDRRNPRLPRRRRPGRPLERLRLPFFTLDTVRLLSAETLKDAAKYGYDCSDTIHVIDGGTDNNGAPRAVVLHIRWMYLEEEGPAQVASVINPRKEDGLYGIGGWEWTWSISTWDCACRSWYYHETEPCPNCGGERPSRFELAA